MLRYVSMKLLKKMVFAGISDLFENRSEIQDILGESKRIVLVVTRVLQSKEWHQVIWDYDEHLQGELIEHSWEAEILATLDIVEEASRRR